MYIGYRSGYDMGYRTRAHIQFDQGMIWGMEQGLIYRNLVTRCKQKEGLQWGMQALLRRPWFPCTHVCHELEEPRDLAGVQQGVHALHEGAHAGLVLHHWAQLRTEAVPAEGALRCHTSRQAARVHDVPALQLRHAPAVHVVQAYRAGLLAYR